jgi:hypothetical protein
VSISENIAAREAANEYVELAGEQPQRFWEVVAELAGGKLPPRPQPVDRLPPMTEQEATRFESEAMPYGKHAGIEVGIVDPSYILFLTEGDEFSKKLKRYVKSRRFAERQSDD